MTRTFALSPVLAALVLAAALAPAACGSSSTTPTADAPAATSADAPTAPADAPPDAHAASTDAGGGSKLVLDVPATYAGTPRELAVVATKQVPIAGPPDDDFLLDMKPAAVAGHAITLSLDTSMASGDLYVVAVLYQQGGGTFAPMSGVDYVAQSASAFHFTGAPLDLGTLTLALAP